MAVVVAANTKMDDHDLRLDRQYDWAHGAGEKNSDDVDADDIDIDFVVVVVVKRQEVEEHSHDSYWKNIGTVVAVVVAVAAVHTDN